MRKDIQQLKGVACLYRKAVVEKSLKTAIDSEKKPNCENLSYLEPIANCVTVFSCRAS